MEKQENFTSFSLVLYLLRSVTSLKNSICNSISPNICNFLKKKLYVLVNDIMKFKSIF